MSPFENVSMFQQNLGRLQELQQLEEALRLEMQSASTQNKKPPWMRKAFSPTEMLRSGVQFTPDNPQQYASQLQRQMSSVLGEQQIARAAANLHVPPAAPSNPISPRYISMFSKLLAGPGLFLLPELLQHGLLGKGEQEELERRRKMPPTIDPQ